MAANANNTNSPLPQLSYTNTIRSGISQTVQEREIIKTAPDIVVFIDGLPYLTNVFLNPPNTGQKFTLVNFNEHVTTFSATYDVDAMVPNCSIGLQVPNYQKYLYQMPGGNNLLQTMAQVQVYAKSYNMASTGDTVYRRVFKGVSSHISYNDNGKTLEISLQCQGALYMLEKMQINIHPSANNVTHSGSRQTIFQSILGTGDCFSILSALFTEGLRSDGFQFGSLNNDTLLPGQNNTSAFYDSVTRGYITKWQAILTNMVKDVHIYGPNKDNLGDELPLDRDPNYGNMGKMLRPAALAKRPTKNESQTATDYGTYYTQIQKYYPFRNITALDMFNDVIVNRLDVIREVVRKMDFEAYQDIDGKIIIKPPIYNLDVVNLGPQSSMTSTALNSSSNSLTNAATQIYPTNNPFVIYLSEILTEQETEDQAAIRRTRTTIVGNILRELGNQYPVPVSQVGEYIDIPKLAKFGLREEPLYQVPWIAEADKATLFAHAAAETVRANRGYRTYTFTIPMRPELKIGFPVFIPHKDMYCYIKSISCNYTVGGTATMTVTCDSIRRRVLINTQQTIGTGSSTKSNSAYTSAPNLVFSWTKNAPQPTQPDPAQAPSNSEYWQSQASNVSQGGSAVSNNQTNPSSPIGVAQLMPSPSVNPDGSKYGPSPQQLKVYTTQAQNIGSTQGNMFNTPYATYVVANDGDKNAGTAASPIVVNGTTYWSPGPGGGYFTSQRPADYWYVQALCGNTGVAGFTGSGSVLPYTDDKGYELISPFPWGRWIDLNTALKEFTEQGWVQGTTSANGTQTPQSLNDLVTLANTDAFLFAGLGTPSATGDSATQLIQALNEQIQLVGGSSIATAPPVQTSNSANTNTTFTNQSSIVQPDFTVIVLHYDPSQPGSFADNSLLNQPQPENKYAESLLTTTQSSTQQLVNVLVSGVVNPIPTAQEQVIVLNQKNPAAQNVKLLNTITPNPNAPAGQE